MSGNTRFFNKIFYIQYYDSYDDKYFWRFWVLWMYFDTDSNKL